MARNLKKASIAPTAFFSAAGLVLSALVIVSIVLPMFISIPLGGTAKHANSIDSGFAGLIQKADSSIGVQVSHALTVDKGFYLVSFNRGGTRNGEALSPPECGAQTCFCVCVSSDCQKIDINNNKARDCRPLRGYSAVSVSGNIEGNKGGGQLYIKGAKTTSMTIEKSGTELLLKGK